MCDIVSYVSYNTTRVRSPVQDDNRRGERMIERTDAKLERFIRYSEYAVITRETIAITWPWVVTAAAGLQSAVVGSGPDKIGDA